MSLFLPPIIQYYKLDHVQENSNPILKMRFLKSLFVLIFLIATQAPIFSQDLIKFRGIVYDRLSKEPLPYTTVSIPHTGTGVITNEFGEFVYHTQDFDNNDQIQISHLGYKSLYINVNLIDSGATYTFHMISEPIIIDGAEVDGIKGTPSSEIVNLAIQKIARNYPRRKFQLSGYYRDYIRDLNTNDYNNLIEAAILIEDSGFDTYDYAYSKILIEQLRYNSEYHVDSMLNMGYDSIKYIPHANVDGSNDLALLLLQNPIRNFNKKAFSFVYRFDTHFLTNHNFVYESFIDNDGSTIFEIKFDTYRMLNEEINSEYWVEGKIYINEEDFAILKFIYTVNCKLPSYSGKFFDLNLEYIKHQNKYYLNYLSVCNYFEFSSDTSTVSKLQPENLFQYREFFVNKIETENFDRIRKKESIRKDTTLISNIIIARPEFWKDYNYTLNKKLLE